MNSTFRSGASKRRTTGATNEFHQVRVQEKQFDTVPRKSATVPPAVDPENPSFFVPSLQVSSAEALAKNFASMPDIDLLRDENPELYRMIVARLPVDEKAVPLSSSVPRITDEDYWRRCCEARWSRGQLSKLSKEKLLGKQYGWKRLYLENVLSDYLMSLRSSNTVLPAHPPLLQGVASGLHHADQPRGDAPTFRVDTGLPLVDTNVEPLTLTISSEEAKKLDELCSICRDYIQTVELPCQFTHLNLYDHLFSKCPGIRSFRLTYNVSNAGIGYDKAMVGFTEADAQSVRFLLRKYPALDTLRLPSNRITDDYTKAICAGMVGNNTLRVLDLSRNELGDMAAQTLSLLLSCPDCTLEEVILDDNNIGSAGVAAFAEALEVNKAVRVLSLSENKIPDDEGVTKLLTVLPKQPTLTHLGLAHNRLGGETARTLSKVLPALSALVSLDLSGNRKLGGVAKPVEPEPQLAAAGTNSPSVSASHTASPVVNGRGSLSQTDTKSAVGAETGAESNANNNDEKGGEASSSASVSAGSPTQDVDKAQVLPSTSASGTSAVPPLPPPAVKEVHSDNGEMLIKAVQSNHSLRNIDVRLCNLTRAEETLITETVRRRSHEVRYKELAEKEAAARTAMQRAISEKIERTRGM